MKDAHDLLLVDMGTAPVVVQLTPRKAGDNEYAQKGPIRIFITDLSEDHAQRQSILDENPAWLQRIESEERDHFLHRQIIFKLGERFLTWISDDLVAYATTRSERDQFEDEET